MTIAEWKMELLDLPNEMLQHIASFLPSSSLARLGETCKLLNSISNIDSLWQSLCFREYQVSKNDGWNVTFKQIYTKFLLPLPVLGLRRAALSPMGGLIHLKWCEGEIQVNRLEAGATSQAPLISSPLFNLRWNEEQQDLEIKCVQRKSDSAPAKIAQGGKYTVFQCSDVNCSNFHRQKALYLGQSHKAFPEGFEDHADVFKGLQFYDGFNCPLLPLRCSSFNDLCPVTPGIYKGDYGAHGVEILQAGMNEDQSSLFECLKLTGDPNVPAGNVSIKVSLDRPMLLPYEEQEMIGRILELDYTRTEEDYASLRNSNNGNPDLRQPFRIPRDCSERDGAAPKTCLARYSGLGRIAGHFFSSPSFCKLHFIKFDADTFGILWLELYCFSIFHREKETFPISVI